jgi:hypothetical protein
MNREREMVKGRRRYVGLAKASLCLALMGAMPGHLNAFDVDYEVGVAAQHSDNIALRDRDEISDTVVSPRLWFAAEQAGSRVQVSAQGNVGYHHYVDGTFDDQVRGSFTGRLNWSVIPQRLDFVVQDYLSLQPVNQFAAFSPANEQQVNVFMAGPTLYARFGDATRGQLDLRYIDSYAEEDEGFDSSRYNAVARVVREVSATTSVSANLEATDVDFDLPGRASDYKRYDGYATLEMDRPRLDVRADFGYSRLELAQSAVPGASLEESYPLARLNLDWRLSPRSSIGATVRHQLTDAAEYLINTRDIDFGLDRRNVNFNEFRIPDSVIEPNVFRERLIRARYSYNGERLDLRVAPFHRRMRYVEGLVEDQERRGIVANLDFRLRPRTTVSVYAVNSEREFQVTGREDKDWIGGVGLSHRFTRKWTGRVDLEHRTRESTEFGRSYDENAVMVSLSYRR